MKEIAQAYDQMLSHYTPLFEEIQKKEALTAYTNFDFFSFQPEFQNLDNIQWKRQNSLYKHG